MANLPADLRKLLEWLDRVSPLLEAQIVAAGFKANFPSCALAPARALRRCRPRFSRRVPRQLSVR